jgi:hypothetical protein
MSTQPHLDEFPESEGFDRIAKDLPADLRAAYYRELLHCNSLPKDDEMLRVLRILQILTYLIQRAPEVVVKEREKIEQFCEDLIDALANALRSTESYHAELDKRLTQLPQEVAKGIQPQAVAKAMFESLRQEFVRSGIPQIGESFQPIAADLKQTVGDIHGAASDIKRASRDVVNGMHQTEQILARESERLMKKYWWLHYTIAGLVIALVFVCGMWLQGELDMNVLAERTPAATVEQQPPPAVQLPSKKPR